MLMKANVLTNHAQDQSSGATHCLTNTKVFSSVPSSFLFLLQPVCAVCVDEVEGLILCMAVGAETDREPQPTQAKRKVAAGGESRQIGDRRVSGAKRLIPKGRETVTVTKLCLSVFI